MKKLTQFAVLSLVALFSAHGAMAQSAFHPNNCADGGLYRAMQGPNVTTDLAGTKTLAIGGQTLIECKVGNTTSCVGTTYNNFTCSVNIAGAPAAALAQNLSFEQTLNGKKVFTLTNDGMTSGCGFMFCTAHTAIMCDDKQCSLGSFVDGWDE